MAAPASTQASMAAHGTLPEGFAQSYAQWKNYPQNLIPRAISMYPTSLESSKNRLEATAAHLFVDNEDDTEVFFRDLGVEGVPGGLAKRLIRNDTGLQAWLGTQERPDPTNSQRPIVTADKKDPKSRFM